MSSARYVAVLAALLAAVGGVAPSSQAHARPRTLPSIQLLRADSGRPSPSRTQLVLISADFEPAEGFFLGPLHGQNGCETSGPNVSWASVAEANPASGNRHLRIVRDPTVPPLTARLALTSPTGLGANSPTQTTQLIYVSNDGGADYHVVGQTPSQGLIAWHVVFSFSDDTQTGPGTIYVVDQLGAELGFVNTGVRWTPGVYVQLKVEFEPLVGEIRYFYGGALIHTGSIFAATTVEQIVWISDNFQLGGEHADIDRLVLIDSATDPVPVGPASWGRVKAAYR